MEEGRVGKPQGTFPCAWQQQPAISQQVGHLVSSTHLAGAVTPLPLPACRVHTHTPCQHKSTTCFITQHAYQASCTASSCTGGAPTHSYSHISRAPTNTHYIIGECMPSPASPKVRSTIHSLNRLTHPTSLSLTNTQQLLIHSHCA